MKTVILIRHGESTTNVLKIFTGQLDTPLTETGMKQAQLMAAYLDRFQIEKVYASTLSRACETAAAIVNRQRCPMETCDAFREINAGYWQGLSFEEISEKYTDTYRCWKENLGKAHPDGGESCSSLYNRVISQLLKIVEDTPEQTVCIVTHATPIRMIESYISGGCVEYAQNISWVPNASASVYHYDGVFHPVIRGYCGYLGDMLTNLPKTI